MRIVDNDEFHDRSSLVSALANGNCEYHGCHTNEK